MSTVIESIIEGKAAEKQAAQEEQRQKRQEAGHKLFEDMTAALGEFWDVLLERREKTGEPFDFKFSWDREKPTLHFNIPALDDHRLAPIWIEWDENSRRSGFYSNKAFHVWGYPFSDMSEALFYAREHYDDYKAKEKKEKVEKFNQALNWNMSREDMTEEQAREILSSHLAEYPDREEEATNTLEHWIQTRKNFFERKEQDRREYEDNEAKRAILQTIKIGYILALAEWMKERDSILAKNQEIAEAIQIVSDSRPYIVYQLTYALVVDYNEDGESERMIETRSVYTLQSEPDKSGFWVVDGKTDPEKFYNPVSLTKREVKASSGILSHRLATCGIELHFAPSVPYKKIEEIFSESGIQGLPDEPKAPEELGPDVHYYRTDYLRKAREPIASQGESGEAWEDQRDEVPF